jgi:hypothetical protein
MDRIGRTDVKWKLTNVERNYDGMKLYGTKLNETKWTAIALTKMLQSNPRPQALQ